MLRLAAIAHLTASVLTYAVGASQNTIWDVGHALLSPRPWLGPVVECATVLIPLGIWYTTPRRERRTVSRQALVSYSALTVLRACSVVITVLPALLRIPPVSPLMLITGTGRDFIFSGHTAFVASWALAAGPSASVLLGVCAALHGVGLIAARMHYTIDIALAWALAYFLRRAPPPLTLAVVVDDEAMREDIYRARHEIYADELGQYPSHPDNMLTDYTDTYNTYIVATRGGVLHGFIAITPPGHRKGLQKHGVDPQYYDSYEFRLLSVLPGCRRQKVASALMYAAGRYVQASGGAHIEALARKQVLPVYVSRGMKPGSQTVTVGNVEYVHIHASVDDLNRSTTLPPGFVWDVPFLKTAPTPCMHGGKGLESLDPQGIQADVQDAWFPPAPSVLAAIADHHADDIKTTPPTRASDLVSALAVARGLEPNSVVLGAGSSDLIYRCFFAWLTPTSRVLLMHPTYAEYEHVLRAIGCEITYLELKESNGYHLTPEDVPDGDFDMVVLTNPNSPTGVLSDVRTVADMFDSRTRIWVDETYINFVGSKYSLEPLLQERPNIIVCKSMSKSYALSGLRVGYVCAHPMQLDAIRARTPPWIVSRLAQRAAVEALKSEGYYAGRYEETHVLRQQLATHLVERGWRVVPGSCANFVMCRPPHGTSAPSIVEGCAAENLYVRLVDEETIRIAVKDADTLQVMLHILDVCASGNRSRKNIF